MEVFASMFQINKPKILYLIFSSTLMREGGLNIENFSTFVLAGGSQGRTILSNYWLVAAADPSVGKFAEHG